MTRVTVRTRNPSVQTSNRGTASEATQSQVNTGTATGVYVSPATLQGRIDTDGTLASNSDVKIPSQKAVKTYVDANGGGGTWGSITGTLSSQTDLQNALNAKQDTLVSATNIKTINGNTLLGSGDLAVTGGGVSGLTATRVPYAQDATTLIDSANLTWDNTNKLLSVNSIRIGDVMPSTAASAELSTVIGNGAGTTTNTTTSRRGNVAVGYQAMASLTNGTNFYDGAYSVAIGYQALNANTTGGYNTAVGYKALAANTTAIQSAAFGYFALRYNTGGANTAFGYLALQGASGQSTGSENTAFGRTALSLLTTGNRNCAFGPNLQALTTGNYNVVGGSESFERLTTQSSNTGWGHWAGVYNRGSNNTAIGAFAMGQATLDNVGNTASYNVCLGANSGNFLAVGDYNIYIGYESGGSSTSDNFSNSIAIGKQTKVTASNSCVIGGTTDANRNNYGFGGEGYGSGLGVLYIKNAVTDASSAGTNGIIIHAKDSSDGAANSTLALYLEQAPEATATFTQTHRLKVWINGVEYYLSLDAV